MTPSTREDPWIRASSHQGVRLPRPSGEKGERIAAGDSVTIRGSGRSADRRMPMPAPRRVSVELPGPPGRRRSRDAPPAWAGASVRLIPIADDVGRIGALRQFAQLWRCASWESLARDGGADHERRNLRAPVPGVGCGHLRLRAAYRGLMSGVAVRLRVFRPGRSFPPGRSGLRGAWYGHTPGRRVDRLRRELLLRRPDRRSSRALVRVIAEEAARSPISGSEPTPTGRPGTGRCRSSRVHNDKNSSWGPPFRCRISPKRQMKMECCGVTRSVTVRWSGGAARSVWTTAPNGKPSEDAPQWRRHHRPGPRGISRPRLAGGGSSRRSPRRGGGGWRDGAARAGTMFEWSYRARTRASGYRHFEVRAVPDHPAQPGGRVGGRQHRRHPAARGRGDARPADRPARRRGAADRATRRAPRRYSPRRSPSSRWSR